MKITVDTNAYEEHRICEAIAPDRFDDYLQLAYDTVDVPTERVDDARHAIASCPALALREVDV